MKLQARPAKESEVQEMKNVDQLVSLGNISLNQYEDGISLVFEPVDSDLISKKPDSILIIRPTAKEAFEALQEYIDDPRRCNDMPREFFEPDYDPSEED